jgi:hypothetical protein
MRSFILIIVFAIFSTACNFNSSSGSKTEKDVPAQPQPEEPKQGGGDGAKDVAPTVPNKPKYKDVDGEGVPDKLDTTPSTMSARSAQLRRLAEAADSIKK